MRLVKPSIEHLWHTQSAAEIVERAGRTCYKSEDKMTSISAKIFIRKLIESGHEAMIEHASVSYKVICDRGVTHEIVRHRLFSYAQESTRYCNYRGGVAFIIPPWFDIPEGVFDREVMLRFERKQNCAVEWLEFLLSCEAMYKGMIDEGFSPQQARSVLPNALKTELIITGNMREWRHFFKLRTAKSAHSQMQEVAKMLLYDVQSQGMGLSVFFEDIVA